MTKRLMSLMALGLLLSAVGWGYTIDLLTTSIPGARLWNTGFESDGTYGTNDAKDGHYTWVRWTDGTRTFQQSTDSAFIINDPPNFPLNVWAANISNTAAWVSTAAGPPNINQEAWFSFYTTFTLPNSFPAWNLNLEATVWADNLLQSVTLIHSLSLGSNSLYAYSNPNPSGEFLGYQNANGVTFSQNVLNLSPGLYTVRFDVYNSPGGFMNPTGLLVRFTSATATGVPEPATYALMGTVGFALFLLRRRKAAAKN